MKKQVHFKNGRIVFFLFSLLMIGGFAWGQAVTTVVGNETYTIGLSTSLATPANIKSAAHYQVTNSGTNYLNHAIQTALNAGYTKIYIEEGTYLVTAPINFYKSNLGTNLKPLLSGITIEGAGKGTIIKPSATSVGHIFNLGVFQLAGTERLTNTYCENNIIQNLFLDLDSKIKTGIRIGGRGQYNTIENVWIQNAAVASIENYRTTIVNGETVVNDIVEKSTQEINATVTTGAGAIYVDLPINIAYVPNISPSNPSGLAYEADFNKFNNIFIRNCNIGISFNFMNNAFIASVFNGNNFNNINIDSFKTAVDFGPVAAMCNSNTFSNFGIQPDKTNNQFVFRRIHGDRDLISNINVFDWAAASPSIFIYDISTASRELTIENSFCRITGTLNGIPNASNFYYNDAGQTTKFINMQSPNLYSENLIKNVHNFQVYGQPDNNINDDQIVNNQGKSNEVSFKDFNIVRFYKDNLTLPNYFNNPDFIIGGYRETGIINGGFRFRPIADPTPASGGNWVLSNEDAWGKVKWTKVSDLLSASSWNHIASQNIKMNNFAIVNNPAVPDPANAPGIRLDDNGNVRVGTEAPVAYTDYTDGPKLKIDGDVEASQGIFTTTGLPNGSVFSDSGDRNDKCIVLSAGSNIGTGSGYKRTRMLNVFDFPASNLDAKPNVLFGIEDRNDMGRFRMGAQANGSTGFKIMNKSQQNLFDFYEDGNDNVTLTMQKENSALAIGTTTFSYPGDVVIGVNDGNYKLVVNGKIRGTGLKLTTQYWSDFVFAKEYQLPTLQAVEQHIIEKGHLPNIPSEKEVVEKGLDVVEMAKLQMQKIEELTLYIIEQNKKIEALESKVNELQTKK